MSEWDIGQNHMSVSRLFSCGTVSIWPLGFRLINITHFINITDKYICD